MKLTELYDAFTQTAFKCKDCGNHKYLDKKQKTKKFKKSKTANVSPPRSQMFQTNIKQIRRKDTPKWSSDRSPIRNVLN